MYYPGQRGLNPLKLVILITVWMSGCAGFAGPVSPLSVTPSSLSVSATIGNIGSEVATVTNIGSSDVDVTRANVSGTAFGVVGLNLPITLSPGKSRNFIVTFAGSRSGSFDGSLSIGTDAEHRPLVVRLRGEVPSSNPEASSVTLSPPSASLAPNGKLQFTATVQGLPHDAVSNKTVTWTATLGSISSAGVYTAPAHPGNATITATSNADPSEFASATVVVTAIVPPPTPISNSPTASPGQLSASVSTLNFNNVNVASSSTKAVTFTNDGKSDIAISNVTVSGVTYDASRVPAGLVLSPGQNVTFNVTFAPAAAGIATGNLKLISNASNSPTSIALSGTGVQVMVHLVTLTWAASTTPGVTGYNVYRTTVSGVYATPLNSSPIPAFTLQYEDSSTVQAGETYYYVMTAIDSSNVQSLYSTEVSVTIPGS